CVGARRWINLAWARRTWIQIERQSIDFMICPKCKSDDRARTSVTMYGDTHAVDCLCYVVDAEAPKGLADLRYQMRTLFGRAARQGRLREVCLRGALENRRFAAG